VGVGLGVGLGVGGGVLLHKLLSLAGLHETLQAEVKVLANRASYPGAFRNVDLAEVALKKLWGVAGEN